MPEIIIKYKNKRTLEALYDFAKYFDFEISVPALSAKKKATVDMSGIPIIPADSSMDTTELSNIFTGKKIDSSELRKKEWKRKR